MRRTLTILVIALAVTSCGSDKQPENPAGLAPPVSDSGSPSSGKTEAVGSDDVSHWFEEDLDAPVATAHRPTPPTDPDATIARYKGECPKGTDTAQCRALRLEVEAIFLQALVTVRASDKPVDPRWYRFAAASETPQLVCIGVNELIWDPNRTSQDEGLILRALDSPYHAVRGAAVLWGVNRIPALGGLWPRNAGFDYSELSGLCVDDGRAPIAHPKWAGDYPGAQFRVFASNQARRWFTTADPPEKVIAWFAARGKAARTEQQIRADAQARYMEEMTRLSSDPEVDNTQAMMQLMMNQAADSQWSEPFRNMEGIGEIRYVKIGAAQAIAIFRDDLYQATSIVAHQPQGPATLTATTADIEAIREKEAMRHILGY
jgi:hypothetical protein